MGVTRVATGSQTPASHLPTQRKSGQRRGSSLNLIYCCRPSSATACIPERRSPLFRVEQRADCSVVPHPYCLDGSGTWVEVGQLHTGHQPGKRIIVRWQLRLTPRAWIFTGHFDSPHCCHSAKSRRTKANLSPAFDLPVTNSMHLQREIPPVRWDRINTLVTVFFGYVTGR